MQGRYRLTGGTILQVSVQSKEGLVALWAAPSWSSSPGSSGRGTESHPSLAYSYSVGDGSQAFESAVHRRGSPAGPLQQLVVHWPVAIIPGVKILQAGVSDSAEQLFPNFLSS